MLTLHLGNKNYSSWSMRPWLVLKASGLSFEEVVHPLFEADWETSGRAGMPAGKVPVLQDGGVTVWDSLAIAEYVAELCPAAGLWPDPPAVRAVARAVSAEMHSGFMDLRRNMDMNIRKLLPGRGMADGVDRDIARIQAIWADCRNFYGGSGDFLFGRFTIADAMYAPVVMRFVTYDVTLGPTAAAYRDAVLKLPMVQEWIAAAKAEPWVIERYEKA